MQTLALVNGVAATWCFSAKIEDVDYRCSIATLVEVHWTIFLKEGYSVTATLKEYRCELK